VDDSAQYDNQNHLTQWYNNTFGPFSVQYDGAGNIVDDGVYAYIYDAEGRVCAQGVHQYQYGYIEWTQFLYDAAGNRVAKGNIDWASCDTTTNGFGLTNQYILGPNGEQMTELTAWSGAPTWAHTNAFAGSTLLATYANDGMGQHFRLTDWLGTTRVQVSPAGRVETTCSSFPFGEEPGNIGYGSACGAATEQFFTGKERDPGNGGMIAGNDFFGARYYSSNVGRFLSPDWTTKANDPVPYAKLNDPQSLNLYAYVGNNPLSRTDPDGHCRLEGAELGAGCSALNEGAEMLQEHTHIGGWSTKKDTTPARFIMKGKPKDHGSWTEYHYQLTNAEGKPLTGTTIYDHDGSQNTATEYYYNQGSLKDPISTGRLPYGVATDSVGWGRLNPKDVPKDDTEQKLDIGFTVDYLGKIYPITTVMEHDNKYSDGKYANTVKIIVP
jgi:RHS repeat-associated protein